MATGIEHVSPQILDYVISHSSPPDAVLAGLREETARRFPDWTVLQIGAEQGTFMTMLSQLVAPRRAVEVGTFTGYSSICLARGLAPGGSLLCCDVNADWTSLAREYWQKAGLDSVIELRLGPGADTLRSLPADPSLDLAFIDADKAGYAFGLPVGVSFMGRPFSEAKLLSLAYAFEQETKVRRPPEFKPTVSLT